MSYISRRDVSHRWSLKWMILYAEKIHGNSLDKNKWKIKQVPRIATHFFLYKIVNELIKFSRKDNINDKKYNVLKYTYINILST